MKFDNKLSRFGILAVMAGAALGGVACERKKSSQVESKNLNNALLGHVDGKNVTLSDLSDSEKNTFYKNQKQFYDSTENLLSQHYFNKYLEDYREKNKMASLDDAKKNFFDKNAKVDKTEVDKFLKDNEASPQLKQIPEDKRVEIVTNYLTQMAQSRATQQIITAALSEGRIVVKNMEKPIPPKVTFQVEGYPLFANNKTPVTIVEFADYQCPYCVNAHVEIQKILSHYNAKDQHKVQFVYYDYPLPFHDQAMAASVAAYCSSLQGQFWEMHDLIFKRRPQDALTPETFTDHAKALNLDLAKFKKCQDDPKSAEHVNKQMSEGQRLGVRGTPSVFINGVPFEKQVTAENVEEAIKPLM